MPYENLASLSSGLDLTLRHIDSLKINRRSMDFQALNLLNVWSGVVLFAEVLNPKTPRSRPASFNQVMLECQLILTATALLHTYRLFPPQDMLSIATKRLVCELARSHNFFALFFSGCGVKSLATENISQSLIFLFLGWLI